VSTDIPTVGSFAETLIKSDCFGFDVCRLCAGFGDRRYVVQTKRRAGNAAESVASIREFVGAMVLAAELRGIFVTSAHMTNSGEGDKPSFNLRTTQRY